MADGCTTTKKDFEAFKKEANAWIKKFGLLDWKVEYEHNDENDDSRAVCVTDVPSKLCVITLTVTWDRKPSTLDIKEHAFHEVCELLLAQIRHVTVNRFDMTLDAVNASFHYVIMSLLNSVYKPLT